MEKNHSLPSHLIILVFAVGLLVATIVGTRQGANTPAVDAAPNSNKPVKNQRITGHVSSDQLDLVIAAIVLEKNNSDGVAQIQGNFQIAGVIISPKGLRGPVVEVTTPTASNDYWCLNTMVDNIQGLENYNVLVYAKDAGDGKSSFDELAFADGFNLGCETSPTPITPFMTVDKGDLKSNL